MDPEEERREPLRRSRRVQHRSPSSQQPTMDNSNASDAPSYSVDSGTRQDTTNYATAPIDTITTAPSETSINAAPTVHSTDPPEETYNIASGGSVTSVFVGPYTPPNPPGMPGNINVPSPPYPPSRVSPNQTPNTTNNNYVSLNEFNTLQNTVLQLQSNMNTLIQHI